MRLDAHRLRSEYQARLDAGDTPTEAREWARDVAEGTARYRALCLEKFRLTRPLPTWPTTRTATETRP